MRVVVASDAQSGLTGGEASEVIASAFADEGAEVAVARLATSGPALSDALGAAASEYPVMTLDSLTEAIGVLRDLAESAVLDATQLSCSSADQLIESEAFWLDASERGAEHPLVLLVDRSQTALRLTGLTGLAATAGREAGRDLGQVLAEDDRIGQWARAHGIPDSDGAGAAGGLGAMIQRLGGRVVDPLTYLCERLQLVHTMGKADLVVTGAEVLDFHDLGGPIVTYLTALAQEALRPIVAIVGRSYISPRELRLAGVETAYPVLSTFDGTPDAAGLRAVAAKVARTWVG